MLPQFMIDTEDKPQPEKDLEFLKNKVAHLMEHFDSVQVFATKTDHDAHETRLYDCGRGDWYARFGAAKMWVKTEEGKGL